MSVLAVVGLLVVVAVVVVVWLGFTALTRRQNRGLEEAVDSGADVLRYQVIEGQDAATLVAALQAEGYDAVSGGDNLIMINDAEAEREAVRTVIERAPLNPEGDQGPGHPVRFVDEEGTAS